MSLETIRSECADWAGLLQPFVDGELDENDQERVASHMSGCQPCRTAVGEQSWVRGMLRNIERERAPQALRANILLGLDEADREDARTPAGTTAPWWSRLRDLARGGMVMVPAGAVAMGLFFLARQGAFPGQEPVDLAPMAAAQMAPATATAVSATNDGLLSALAKLEPQVGFPVQVAAPNPNTGVELVGARLAGTSGPPSARLEYRMVGPAGQPTGHRVVDVQTSGPMPTTAGTRQVFRGRTYHLTRDADGRAHVHFSTGGVAHVVSIDGAAALPLPAASELSSQERDFATLLLIANELARNSADSD
jgi:anti-sigma factor (TIGR02949 family)